MNLHKAIEFAATAHKGQSRKGSDVPYIVHPFEVAQILIEAGASEDIVTAGLLHDTIEDTAVSADDIELLFGDEVLSLVMSDSEDKSKTWEERKQATIDFLKNEATFEELMLACADKLSNLRSMKADSDILGDKLWERFNRGKDSQKQYYAGLIEALEALSEYEMYAELKELYEAVF